MDVISLRMPARIVVLPASAVSSGATVVRPYWIMNAVLMMIRAGAASLDV